MKTIVHSACLALICLAAPAQAASLTVLKGFPITGNPTGYSAMPVGNLASDGVSLYGTTSNPVGSGNSGIAFRMDLDGSDYEVIHNFTGGPADGAAPTAGVTFGGSRLYGTTIFGGANGTGTLYSMNPDGTGYQLLHSIGAGAEGPWAEVVVDGNSLYGTTFDTAFRMNTDGTNFQTLQSFSTAVISQPALNNSVLYVGTDGGASFGDVHGRLYSIPTSGGGVGILHQFNGPNGHGPSNDLLVSGSTIYGTTWGGGQFDYGTVFKIGLDGSGFQVLHSFNNSAGAAPGAGLTVIDGVLYGSTQYGGTNDVGTIFKINPDGSGFQTLRHLDYDSDGGHIQSKFLAVGLTLYGVAMNGGPNGGGTVFAFTIPEPSTLALGAAGLGMLVLAAARRRLCGASRRSSSKQPDLPHRAQLHGEAR